jgi:hypothetical protein
VFSTTEQIHAIWYWIWSAFAFDIPEKPTVTLKSKERRIVGRKTAEKVLGSSLRPWPRSDFLRFWPQLSMVFSWTCTLPMFETG